MAAGANEFEVVRDTTIPAPRSAVFALLVDFHRWTEWSPWEDLDPNLWRGYSGADAGRRCHLRVGRQPQGGRGAHGDHHCRRAVARQIALQFLKPFKSSTTTTFTLGTATTAPR